MANPVSVSRVHIHPTVLQAFCNRHHVRRLSLFGSVLRDDFRPDSDIDLLVQFEPNNSPGFFGLAQMTLEMENLLGRTVDLRTAGDLSRYFRAEVLAGAEPLYAAG